ncbi:MAG TPA: NAD-dependent succinate-semialdehyde dehydrogenase [Candidatus Hydrogenedentes bacterium]|nr:NAD-dependent succinate-semialdehyde dehydrogenase [Candidatus Hydrogenedentota bacterium]
MKTYPLYLNGTWVNSHKTIDVVDPARDEAVARISTVDRAGVAKALSDAQAAFPRWRGRTATERAACLEKVADALDARKDEIAATLTMENGKPLAQSEGEVGMSADHFRWFAGEARRAYGRIVPQQTANKRNVVLKTPMGVVGAISPWNFPLVLSARKAAPALAAGCTVVLKPSSKTPLCAVALAECIEAAGLPAGVFQVVVGQAREIAQEFLDNPACRKVTFTGSSRVGKELIRGAADTVKALSLELGGHAPVLVFEDVDRDDAVSGAIIAKYRNTGQSCIAANRIYVQEGIYEQFLEDFVGRVESMKIGPGMTPGVEIGPLIDARAVEQARAHVQDALDRGARLLCGSGRYAGPKGHFFQPTVLADVPDDAVCMHEETFAPVAAVCSFRTEAEGIARANDSRYGLSAYAFTKDVRRVWRLMEQLEAGSIGINDGSTTISQAPFGGMKESGWGRELGYEGMDAFMDTKHISLGGME